MRYALIALWMLLCTLTPAVAQLSINFGLPGVNIGINLPVYPQLQRVPGYPVYYAPGVNSNYFFYDGLYWVYQGDYWYASSWYNGPWSIVDPVDVPLYVLRVPVRYYRHAPAYFRGWRANDAPRWGEHWGRSWEQRRSGWNQWNRRSAPAPAPLPTYQRQYSGNRYPQPSQQAVIQTQNYRYQPSGAVALQNFQHQRAQAQSAQPQQAVPQQQAPRQQQQSQQPKPQQAGQPQQAPPLVREQQAPKPQPQRVERQPQQAPPLVREQQTPKPQPQRVERQPQQAPLVREQQAPKPQPQRVERQPQRAPVAREKQAPPPQAQKEAPPGKEQNKEQGREKDNK